MEHKKLCYDEFWPVAYCATKERFLIVFLKKREKEENKSRQCNLTSFPLLEIKDVTDEILLPIFLAGVVIMKYCMVTGNG